MLIKCWSRSWSSADGGSVEGIDRHSISYAVKSRNIVEPHLTTTLLLISHFIPLGKKGQSIIFLFKEPPKTVNPLIRLDQFLLVTGLIVSRYNILKFKSWIASRAQHKGRNMYSPNNIDWELSTSVLELLLSSWKETRSLTKLWRLGILSLGHWQHTRT